MLHCKQKAVCLKLLNAGYISLVESFEVSAKRNSESFRNLRLRLKRICKIRLLEFVKRPKVVTGFFLSFFSQL